MPELPLAALQPAAAPARVSTRAATSRPERETTEPSTQASARRESSRDNTPRETANRRESGADKDESRDSSRENTGATETTDAASEREATTAAATGAGEDDKQKRVGGASEPFAALLTAQLEARPEEVPGVVLAAIPAGVQQALAEIPAAALRPGGNGLPPPALEEAIARQSGNGAAPAAALHGVDKPTLAATRAGAAPSTVEVDAELVTTDTSRKVAEAVLTTAREELPAQTASGPETRTSLPVFSLANTGISAPASGAATPVTATVEVPFGQPRWAQAFGERVSMMVRDGAQLASLRLDPPHLGPVEVRVSVSNGEASMSFVSAHAPVREAIEAALPRLREMLDEQGLSLGNVDVSGRDARSESEARRGGEQAPDTGLRGSDGVAGDEEPANPLHRARVLQGLLDHYA